MKKDSINEGKVEGVFCTNGRKQKRIDIFGRRTPREKEYFQGSVVGRTSTNCESDVYWTVHHCHKLRTKNQLDATCYFIVLLIGSTRFGHYCAHDQELATVMLITTLVISFLVCCRLEVRCS